MNSVECEWLVFIPCKDRNYVSEMLGYGVDQSGSGQGQVAGTCECGNESSSSIKCGEFLDKLRTGDLLKRDSATWRKKKEKERKKRTDIHRIISSTNFNEQFSLFINNMFVTLLSSTCFEH